MKRFTLFAALILASASAQQAVPVAFAPVTIDGQTTANGLVTINGKQYVSVDALAKSQITVLSPNTLGVYAFPVAAGPGPQKLKGCINEWLTDGTNRVRVTGSAFTTGWGVQLQWQTSENDVVAFDSVFESSQAMLQLKKGTTLDPKINSFTRSVSDVSATVRGGLDGGAIYFFAADLSDKNPPIKMVLRAKKGAPWTFDLTCKK